MGLGALSCACSANDNEDATAQITAQTTLNCSHSAILITEDRCEENSLQNTDANDAINNLVAWVTETTALAITTRMHNDDDSGMRQARNPLIFYGSGSSGSIPMANQGRAPTSSQRC